MSDTLPMLKDLDKPSKWPSANARLLGLGAGLPVQPLDRLADFSADDFERFALEWADGYLREKLPNVTEIQQRGGAGDKGRDIVVWFGKPGTASRHWHLYQCKRYASALGAGKGIAEIAKVLFYSFRGDFSLPSEYWFVTRKGVTGEFQDLIDDPIKLRAYIVDNWNAHCANAIASKKTVALEGAIAYHQPIDRAGLAEIFGKEIGRDLISRLRVTPKHPPRLSVIVSFMVSRICHFARVFFLSCLNSVAPG